jgi:hypothetical protein
MAILPARPSRAPLPLSACIDELVELLAMRKADGCPDCLNTEPAKSWAPLDNGYRTAHLCADCGRAWTTDWRN